MVQIYFVHLQLKSVIFSSNWPLSQINIKCKVAKIKPLYKKGLKADPKNFSPISLLPLVSKSIERISHDLTMNYQITTSYTNINQDLENFTRKTLVCYISMTIFRHNFQTEMVLIDLQKAFNTTDNILI